MPPFARVLNRRIAFAFIVGSLIPLPCFASPKRGVDRPIEDWALLAPIAQGNARVLESASGTLPGVIEVVGAPDSGLFMASLFIPHLAEGGPAGVVQWMPVVKGRVTVPPQLGAWSHPIQVDHALFLTWAKAGLPQTTATLATPTLDTLEHCISMHPLAEPDFGNALFCGQLLVQMGHGLPEAQVGSWLTSEVDGALPLALASLLRRAPTSDWVFSSEEKAVIVSALEDDNGQTQSLAALLARRNRLDSAAPILRAALPFASTNSPGKQGVFGQFLEGFNHQEALPPPQLAMTWALGSLGPAPASAELLYLLLAGSDDDIAFAALRGLERQKDPALLSVLTGLLTTGTPRDFQFATQAMARLGDRGPLPHLIRYIQDPDASEWGIVLVIQTLAALGGEDGEAVLSAQFLTSTGAIKLAAAKGLAAMGSDFGQETLVATLAVDPSGPYAFELSRLLSMVSPLETLTELDTSQLTPAAWKQISLGKEIGRSIVDVESQQAVLQSVLTDPLTDDDRLTWALTYIKTHGLVGLGDAVQRVYQEGLQLSAPNNSMLIVCVETLRRLGIKLDEEQLERLQDHQDGPGFPWKIEFDKQGAAFVEAGL